MQAHNVFSTGQSPKGHLGKLTHVTCTHSTRQEQENPDSVVHR